MTEVTAVSRRWSASLSSRATMIVRQPFVSLKPHCSFNCDRIAVGIEVRQRSAAAALLQAFRFLHFRFRLPHGQTLLLQERQAGESCQDAPDCRCAQDESKAIFFTLFDANVSSSACVSCLPPTFCVRVVSRNGRQSCSRASRQRGSVRVRT